MMMSDKGVCSAPPCCIWILPWDTPKDSDTKADPLGSKDSVLEGGHNSWDEVFDIGEAILAHTPWLIHQKHYVCLYHRPACWGKKKRWISVCTNTKGRRAREIMFEKYSHFIREPKKRNYNPT